MDQSGCAFDRHHILAAIRQSHRQCSGAADLATLTGVQPLPGGLNNTVYAYSDGGEPICIKVYRVDNRQRAEREWNALQFLAAYQPGFVPQPLWFDPDPEFPAIAMAFVPGKPLHQVQNPSKALHALADALHQLYAITPDARSYPYTRVGAVTECVQRIENWAAQVAVSADREFVERVNPLVRHWLQSNDRRILYAPAPQVFGRGDPNLANCLWDGTQLRLIDLEYAGWSDSAFELADLVEHINSRSVFDEDWNNVVAQFIPFGSVLSQRFRAAQRTCALLWLVLLWQRRDAQRPVFLAQLERVRNLQRMDG